MRRGSVRAPEKRPPARPWRLDNPPPAGPFHRQNARSVRRRKILNRDEEADMAGLCEGRVAIVTGGGRGIGREYCLMLAEEGAKVVVNDLGGARDGVGADLGPADEVVNEIRAMGGEAVANGADVSDFEQAKAMIDQAVQTFG